MTATAATIEFPTTATALRKLKKDELLAHPLLANADYSAQNKGDIVNAIINLSENAAARNGQTETDPLSGETAETPAPTTTRAKPREDLVAASTEGEHICGSCAQILPVTKFPTKAADKDGVISRDFNACRPCRAAARAAKKAAAAVAA